MASELDFNRIRPGDPTPPDAVEGPRVLALSDWLPRDARLVPRISELLGGPRPDRPLPTVLVVSDLPARWAGDPEILDDRLFLTELIRAGATVLEPQDEAESAAAQADPVAFARGQYLAAARQLSKAPAPGTLPGPPEDSQPDGYKGFAKAVTRLSAKELGDLIEGRRSDDWRYDA